MARPELGPVKVGDTLYVIQPGRRRDRAYVEVVVTKVGRLWIDMDTPGSTSTRARYRMRLDTQHTGSTYGTGGARFVSPDQRAWQEREDAARSFLEEAGIRHWHMDNGKGRYADRLVELANVIRVHEGLPEL